MHLLVAVTVAPKHTGGWSKSTRSVLHTIVADTVVNTLGGGQGGDPRQNWLIAAIVWDYIYGPLFFSRERAICKLGPFLFSFCQV